MVVAGLCRRYTGATLAQLSERFGLRHPDSSANVVRRAKPLGKASGLAAAKAGLCAQIPRTISQCAACPCVSEPQQSAIWYVRFRPPAPRPGNQPADGRRNRLHRAARSVRKSTKFLTKPPPQSCSERAVGIEKPISRPGTSMRAKGCRGKPGGTWRHPARRGPVHGTGMQ